MRVAWLVVLSVFALHAQAAIMETITQTTTGSCSPAVGQAGGNVTVTCQGLDEQTLARLNEFLDKKFAALSDESFEKKTATRLHQLLDNIDLELQAKIREAEEWAQKYRQLEQRLAAEGQDSPLAQQAQALLRQGKLEEAGALLDYLLDTEEKTVARVAAHHFNRAVVYTLQFQNYKALPHYEKAYQYRPDNIMYAFQYGLTLYEQKSYTLAQPVYESVLRTVRQLAKEIPEAYTPYVALTLNNLGLLYSEMHRFSDSEQAWQEAVSIYRRLVEKNPEVYKADIASQLHDLAILELDRDHFQQAQTFVGEALTMRRALWKQHATMYGDALAQSLVVEVKLLQRRKESVTLICERLQEIANVAVREGLKQWAKDRTVEVCNSLLDTFITHFDIDI